MVFLLHIIFLLFVPPQGQGIISLADDREEYLIPVNEMPVYEESDGKKTFEEVIQHDDWFTLFPDFQPRDYDPAAAYWIKLTLDIPEKREKVWLLEFYDQTIDSIEAYVPIPGGGYELIQLGDMLPFERKPFNHKNFELLIGSELKGQQTFYFRIKSHTYADIRIAVRTVNRFVQYSLYEYFLYGLFYGMILIISLYNLLIYSAIKERKYLYYTFYILSVGIYAMCVDGIAYQFLWPNKPFWNQYAYGTALFSLIFWALLFSQKFLNTRIRAPRLHKAINYVLVGRGLIFLYALLIDRNVFEYRNIEIIPLSLIFYASIRVWVRGYKPARFFVLAYGILFTGFLFKALLYLSVIPFSILTYYSLHVAFMLEMLFLTFALSDRVRILKTNRDRAFQRIVRQHEENARLKDKVNKELEEKVKQRTRELQQKNYLLEETNQRLQEQSEEVNRLNSMLDLDNWKLKKNIRELLQARLVNENLTLEQFRTIFPDKASCYRFLEKLKWGEGYSCIKCGHEKYAPGTTKFSRRCTRCGYNESVTSNTVFHRVKFPVEKALYILYVTLNEPERYTLDELSEMLDLRRNTVWGFKKKLEQYFHQEAEKSSRKLLTNLFALYKQPQN